LIGEGFEKSNFLKMKWHLFH